MCLWVDSHRSDTGAWVGKWLDWKSYNAIVAVLESNFHNCIPRAGFRHELGWWLSWEMWGFLMEGVRYEWRLELCFFACVTWRIRHSSGWYAIWKRLHDWSMMELTLGIIRVGMHINVQYTCAIRRSCMEPRLRFVCAIENQNWMILVHASISRLSHVPTWRKLALDLFRFVTCIVKWYNTASWRLLDKRFLSFKNI